MDADGNEARRAGIGRLFVHAVVPVWLFYAAAAAAMLQLSTGTLVVFALIGVLPSGIGLTLGWLAPWEAARRHPDTRASRWRVALPLALLNVAGYFIVSAFVLWRVWSRLRQGP